MEQSEINSRLIRNTRLFGLYKIFTKRVYIPLTTIYATQQAGLSIRQIGLATSLASVVSLLLDTPTGFWADKHGRKKSAQVGAVLAIIASVCFVFATGFFGILLASVVMAAGYSFLNGSMEALIHDSLTLLGRAEDYAKIASRAQAQSLVANAALVTLVPLLYPIDKRLPFVVSTFAYLLLLVIASSLLEPEVKHDVEAAEVRFVSTIKKLLTKGAILFFACTGFSYAIGVGASDVLNLGIIKVGLQPKYLGIVYGGSALLGAVMGIWVHHLKKLSFASYASIDFLSGLLPFIALGIFKSLPLAIFAFGISLSFWRYQNIMYQHYVLKMYGTTKYKATIISLLTNFSSMHQIWLSIASTLVAQHFGLLKSLNYDVFVILLVWPIMLFSINQFSANAKASLAVSDQ